MEFLHRPSNINNQAVQCLKIGDFHESLKLFQESLKLIMTEIRDCKEQDTSKGSKRIHPLPAEMRKFLLPLGASQSKVQCNGYLVHTEGFPIVDASEASFSSDPILDKQICAAIIVFNLALLFHLKGLQERSQDDLIKSKSLYQQSHRLIINIVGGLDMRNYDSKSLTGNALIDLLGLALWNNLAQINVELKEHVTSEVLLGKVIQCALSIRESNDHYHISGRQISAFMEEQSQLFLLNAQCSRKSNSATAPAA